MLLCRLFQLNKSATQQDFHQETQLRLFSATTPTFSIQTSFQINPKLTTIQYPSYELAQSLIVKNQVVGSVTPLTLPTQKVQDFQSDPSLWPLAPQLCPRAGLAGSAGGLALPGGCHVLFPAAPPPPPAAGAAGAT